LTASELLFERMCTTLEIPFERLQEGEQKTADYTIVLDSERVIVEVKELAPNQAELEAQAGILESGSAVPSVGPAGKRIRYKIDNAKEQLSNSDGAPTILLLFDARPIAVSSVGSYQVMAAMYGLETFDLSVPRELDAPVTISGPRFGKDGKLGPLKHTFISAIAVMAIGDQRALLLDIYLNTFAVNPLPLEHLLRMPSVKVFKLPDGCTGEFCEWVRVGSRGQVFPADSGRAALDRGSVPPQRGDRCRNRRDHTGG